MADLSPAQTALDRIQRAGPKSGLNTGSIRIVYELCTEGLRVHATAHGYGNTKVVTWIELSTCEIDPLREAHDFLFKEMEGLVGDQKREACHAGG